MIYERYMYFLYPRRCLAVMFILASNKWHAGMPAHFTGVNVSYGAPLCFLSTLYHRSFLVTLVKSCPIVSITACIKHRATRNLRHVFRRCFSIWLFHRNCPGFESLQSRAIPRVICTYTHACCLLSFHGKMRKFILSPTCYFSVNVWLKSFTRPTAYILRDFNRSASFKRKENQTFEPREFSSFTIRVQRVFVSEFNENSRRIKRYYCPFRVLNKPFFTLKRPFDHETPIDKLFSFTFVTIFVFVIS